MRINEELSPVIDALVRHIGDCIDEDPDMHWSPGLAIAAFAPSLPPSLHEHVRGRLAMRAKTKAAA